MSDAAAASGSRTRAIWFVAALFVALTVVMAYPLSVRPASTLQSADPDTELFIWTLAWDAHAFLHQPLAIFDANIYYPERRTLAYSENLIGSAFIAAPILWLTGNPVLALNSVMLLSAVFCGLGAYVLGRRLGMGHAAAIVCGLIFAFSPARFLRIYQVHLTTVQWMPFALASLHTYLDGGRRRDLRLAAAFFTLQALTSGHGAVFLVVAVVCLLAYRTALGEPIALTARLRDLGVSGALLFVPTVLVWLPYRRVQVEMGLRRTLDNWAPSPESFLASPTHVQTFLLSLVPDARINENASSFLFPGFLPLLLAALAILPERPGPLPESPVRSTSWRRLAILLEGAAVMSVAIATMVALSGPIRVRFGSLLLFSARDSLRPLFVAGIFLASRLAVAPRVPIDAARRLRGARDAWRRWANAHRRDVTVFYALLTLVAFLLAAGPPIGLWPLVYWLPGMNFIRVPSRFMILVVLGLAVLAGMAVERWTQRVGASRQWLVATALGALLVAEFAVAPLFSVPYRVQIPAADRWLAGQPPPFAVAEVPVKRSERYQTVYMLHSMTHWQKTVHGYSGMRPQRHEQLYRELTQFPDDQSLTSLAQFGVTYIVVHSDQYPPEEWAAVEQRLKQFESWLTLQYQDRAARVYSLRRPLNP